MKILLDHDVPHKLRHLFPEGCEVYTTQYLGWQNLANGDLMKAALDAAFSVFVTIDHDLGFQQNLARAPIGIIFLRRHPAKLATLSKLMPTVLQVLPSVAQGRHVTVFA